MLSETPGLRRLGSLCKHLLPPESIATSSSKALTSAAGASASELGAGASMAGDAPRDKLFRTNGEPVYIVGAARTPLGAFQGTLSHLSATELGGLAVKAAVERSKVAAAAVGEVFLGNVCSANLGQAPARQAALKAGLPLSTDCTTVNKVCSSGLKAVALGAQAIALGTHEIVVCGGMESMSNIPYYAPAARSGARLGHSVLLDGLLRDGLTDGMHSVHMGVCADQCAAQHGISREAQDRHAVESVARARRATQEGTFAWEIVPVEAAPSKFRKGGGSCGGPMVAEDEPIAKMDPDKLRRLPPFFDRESGTVTAGNASPITDGAAAVVLASESAVRRYDLPVLGRILGWADAAQDPRQFPTSPALAIPKALRHAGVSQHAVDYWEVNEAFSVVDLVNQQLLGLDPARVNVLGGAVALGHAIGASGARLLVTLLNVLRIKEDGRIGVAAICNGGGGASAMVILRASRQDVPSRR